MGFWFGVWGLGFRVWGLGFRVWGLGFRAEGSGLRVLGTWKHVSKGLLTPIPMQASVTHRNRRD